MFHPIQVRAVWESGVEFWQGLVEHDGCASRDSRPQPFFGGLGRVGLEDILLQAEFVRLNLWQPVDRFKRACFL